MHIRLGVILAANGSLKPAVATGTPQQMLRRLPFQRRKQEAIVVDQTGSTGNGTAESGAKQPSPG
jgi:hypothetical protein